MMPPICEWIVTVEIAVTWPTGGGSICTGTFVSVAFSTSTGAPAGVMSFLPEQPATRTAATSASADEMEANSFIRSLFDKINFDALRIFRLKGHGEFSQKLRTFML